MRILLVEDDAVLADAISRSLRQGGYAVDQVDNGLDADHALIHNVYDLVILDLSLPKMDGLDVLARLRTRKSMVPTLILTARDSLPDRIAGLDRGADDYLTKPFDLPELEARIRALIRRGHGVANTLLEYGSVRFDTVERRLEVGGEAIELSARELGVLEMLLLRVGRVVSKERLAEHVYGWDEEVGNNAIEVCVYRLRKKLEPSGINIRTVRGLGYLLDKPSA